MSKGAPARGTEELPAVSPELVKIVEREVAAWVSGAWQIEDHSLEALTRHLLKAVQEHERSNAGR